MCRLDLGCYTDSSIGYNSVDEILNHIRKGGYSGVYITDKYCVSALPSIGIFKSDEIHPHPRLHYGLEIDVIDGSETYPLKCLARTQTGINNLYRLVGICEGRPIRIDSLLRYKEGLIMGASGGWDSAAMRAAVDFWFVSPDMDESYCRQFYEAVKATDKLLCAVSNGRYVDPALDDEHSHENRIYTESEMLRRFSYMGIDAAHEIVVHNPFEVGWIDDTGSDSIDGLPHLPGGFRATIDDAGVIVSNMLKAALCKKYSACAFASLGGATPMKTSLLEENAESTDNILVNRLYQEISLIHRNGNDSAFLASARIAEYLRQRGYRPDFRSDINNSFAAYLAGITEVNPMPAHYLCPRCKTLIWARDCAGGYDLPDKECPACGTEMDCDGHDIPCQTALSLNGRLRIECDLPCELADERKAILEYAYPDCIVLPCDNAASPSYCVFPNTCPPDLAKGIASLTPHHIRETCEIAVMRTSDRSSRIAKLEAITGIRSHSIRLNDRALIKYINDPNSVFECGLSGVPEYSDSRAKLIAELLKPARFSELLMIYGIRHGMWKDNAFLDAAFRLESLSRPNALLFREDVFRILLDNGLSVHTARMYAYRISQNSCAERIYEGLTNLRVPDSTIQEIRKIQNLLPKGLAVHRLQSALILAWYRQHCTAHFFAVLLNYTPYAIDFLAKQPSVFLSTEDGYTYQSEIGDLSNALAVISDLYDSTDLRLERAKGSQEEGFYAIDEHTIAYCANTGR